LGLGQETIAQRSLSIQRPALDIDVTAADVQIHNCIFSMNYADIAGVFDLSAAGFVVNNCDLLTLPHP
jgi:hypothetical protein